MNCLYPLNQPVYAMLGEKYTYCFYGESGIVKFYTFQVKQLKDFESVTVLPDGVVDIIFIKHLDGNLSVYSYGTPLVGEQLCDQFFVENGDVLFGVQLIPDVVEMITGIDIENIIGNVIDITKQTLLYALGRSIYKSESFMSKVNLFIDFYREYYLEQYQQKMEKNRLPSYVLEEIIQSRGTKRLSDISERAGYSTRYMNKVFQREYGISPKYFGRVVRFQNIVNELMKEQNLIDISEEVSMYEGNLIREFKAMCGFTPNAYRKVLAQYQTIINQN